MAQFCHFSSRHLDDVCHYPAWALSPIWRLLIVSFSRWWSFGECNWLFCLQLTFSFNSFPDELSRWIPNPHVFIDIFWYIPKPDLTNSQMYASFISVSSQTHIQHTHCLSRGPFWRIMSLYVFYFWSNGFICRIKFSLLLSLKSCQLEPLPDISQLYIW
jgi:hypothetical protein